jgi:tRNA-specific 2-thiouridylase
VQAQVQVRYRAAAVRAAIRPDVQPDRAEVELERPLQDVTPGQAAVFYAGDRCLGGGIIQP